MRLAWPRTAALIGALAGCAPPAPARPAVAVLEVKGPAGREWQERVAELATSRELEVIPAESYRVMATRLDAGNLTARDVARVAAALGATAVVHGQVSGGGRGAKGGRRQLVTIYVRDGASGRVVEKYKIRVRRGVPVGRSQVAFERRLLASFAPPRPRPVAPAQRAAAEKPTAPPRAAIAPAPVDPRSKKATARTARTDRPARETRTVPRPPPEPPAGPVERAPPVNYDESGQAIDDETPPPRR